jgi:Fe-S-cluster containining protein
MSQTLRVDSNLRFSCSQCGRCCHRFDVIVSSTEIDLYKRRGADAWFRNTDGTSGDAFEPIPIAPGFHRIRKRDDGACGFLSPDNRCRIHEELGGAKKPLTCRLFPYAFHSAPDAVVVTASFGCPTIVANQGTPITTPESLATLESLRKEWFDIHPRVSLPLRFVKGRAIDARSSRLLREQLLVMLARNTDDIRENIRRMAATLEDLTRSRVLALPDDGFAEYIALTVPHAATKVEAPPARAPGRIARLLQYGFLYAVTAIRADLEHPGQSRARLRLLRLKLLAHFHGLAPGLERVRVSAVHRRRVDINAPEIRPIVFHYLRSTLETLGAAGRPILDELSIAASYLNAACGLAAMNADAAGTDVDRAIFSQALMEASDVSHARHALLEWVLDRLSGGSDALWILQW